MWWNKKVKEFIPYRGVVEDFRIGDCIKKSPLPADFPRTIQVPKLASLTAQSVNGNSGIARALDSYIPEACRVYGCRVWSEVKSDTMLNVFEIITTHNFHASRLLVSHKILAEAHPRSLIDTIGEKFRYAIAQVHYEEFSIAEVRWEDEADAAYEAWVRGEIQEDDSEGPWTKSKVAPPKPGNMGVQVSPGLPEWRPHDAFTEAKKAIADDWNRTRVVS